MIKVNSKVKIKEGKDRRYSFMPIGTVINIKLTVQGRWCLIDFGTGSGYADMRVLEEELDEIQ